MKKILSLISCIIMVLAAVSLTVSVYASNTSDAEIVQNGDPRYPQSLHNYLANTDQTWEYVHDEPASALNITFSQSSRVENYDYVYLYNGDGQQVGMYNGNQLAGKNVTVPGNSFSIRLVSDISVQYYGFSISYITATPVNGISVKSQPQRTCYPIGGTFSSEGLVLEAANPNGGVGNIYSGYEIGEWDFSTPGDKVISISYGGYTTSVTVTVSADCPPDESDVSDDGPGVVPDYPESDHPYNRNSVLNWTYVHNAPAQVLEITFSVDTSFDIGHDFIIIRDSQNNMQRYSGNALAGKKIRVLGDSFTIEIQIGGNFYDYGFAIEKIEGFQFGWNEDDRGFFYVDENGLSVTDDWVEYESEYYYVDSSGHRTTYHYSGNTLHITGIRVMPDYNRNGTRPAPWIRLSDIIEKVVVEYGVTHIGQCAFSNMVNLTEVDLSCTVFSVGYECFYGCESLQSIAFPEKAQILDPYAFDGCISLQTIRVSKSMTFFNDGTFDGCPNAVVLCDAGSYAHEYTVLHNIPHRVVNKDDNPIASITGITVNVLEGTHGKVEVEWDTPHWCDADPYYKYTKFEPEEITITTKNGHVYTGSIYEAISALNRAEGCHYDYYEVNYYTDQTYHSIWEPGVHHVYASLAESELTFDVHVYENPIVSIVSNDARMEQNKNGYLVMGIDLQRFFVYDVEPREVVDSVTGETQVLGNLGKITITTKSGNTYYGNWKDAITEMNEAENTIVDLWYEVENNDQGFRNKWTLGDHVRRVTLANISFDVNFEVVVPYISSIVFNTVEIVEGDGVWYGDSLSGGGYSDPYFHYSPVPETVTITMANGHVYSGEIYETFERMNEAEGLELNLTGSLTIETKQSHSRNWYPGYTYSSNVTYGGVEASFDTHIIPNEVISINVESISFYDRIGGQLCFDDDGHDFVIYSTYLDSQIITVTMKNGHVYSGTVSEVQSQIESVEHINCRISFECNDNQNYENQWTAGTHHTASIVINRVSASYDIFIADNPILEVTISEIGLTDSECQEQIDAYNESTDESSGVECLKPVSITVNMSGGDTYTGTLEDIIDALESEENIVFDFDDIYWTFDYPGNEGECSYLDVGTNTCYLVMGGMVVSYDVVVTADASETTPTIIPGDLNGDGKVNSSDLSLLSSILSGGITPTLQQFMAADINADGKVNAKDMLLVSKMISGC